MLLGDAAQPRAHPHELQQAVHPVGYSHVGKPDLLKGPQKKEGKDNGTTATRTEGKRTRETSGNCEAKARERRRARNTAKTELGYRHLRRGNHTALMISRCLCCSRTAGYAQALRFLKREVDIS